MPRLVVSPAAQRDIQSILAWTHERFGVQGRLRYEALLVCAILDVADDPDLTGSRTRSDINDWSRIILALCAAKADTESAHKRFLKMATEIANRLAEALHIDAPALRSNANATHGHASHLR